MIFVEVMKTCRKNWKTKNKKYGQVDNNTSKRTFFELGSRLYRSHKTSKKTNMKQIYFGSYRLCD
jgi:hypothetical protein